MTFSHQVPVPQDGDQALEVWLHQTVAPAYDALKADPSRGLTGEQLRARLAARRSTEAR